MRSVMVERKRVRKAGEEPARFTAKDVVGQAHRLPFFKFGSRWDRPTSVSTARSELDF
jgi:hypothetical protein